MRLDRKNDHILRSGVRVVVGGAHVRRHLLAAIGGYQPHPARPQGLEIRASGDECNVLSGERQPQTDERTDSASTHDGNFHRRWRLARHRPAAKADRGNLNISRSIVAQPRVRGALPIQLSQSCGSKVKRPASSRAPLGCRAYDFQLYCPTSCTFDLYLMVTPGVRYVLHSKTMPSNGPSPLGRDSDCSLLTGIGGES